MKLKDCLYGRLVVDTKGSIGMIKGITNNAVYSAADVRRDPERAIPVVEWSEGTTSAVHPNNIELLK